MKVTFASKLSIIFTMSTVLVNAMQSIKNEDLDMLILCSNNQENPENIRISKSRWQGSELIGAATNAPGHYEGRKITLDKESVKLGSLVDSYLKIVEKGPKETDNFLQKLSPSEHTELLAGLQRFGFVDKFMDGDFNNIEESLLKKIKDWLASEVNKKFPDWSDKREWIEEEGLLSEEGNEIIENTLQSLIRPLNGLENFYGATIGFAMKLNKNSNSTYPTLIIRPSFNKGARIIDPKTDEALLLLPKGVRVCKCNENLVTISKDGKEEVINLDNEREKRKIIFSRLKPVELFFIFGLINGQLFNDLDQYSSLWQALDQNVRENLCDLYLTAEQVVSLEGIKTNLDTE